MAAKNLSLDLDFFEKIIIYNCLTDQNYLETIIEHLKSSYFKEKQHATIISLVKNFYSEHSVFPNLTELKAYLTTQEQREHFKEVIISFNSIDKNYNKDLLIKNTEKFLKEKAVLNTMFDTSVNVQSGNIDTASILKKFEEACSISLVDNIGFDYLEDIEKHCEDLQKVFKTVSTGWKWLDKNLGGGFMAEGRALYVFFGITNVGKSIFLGNIATNILNQDKTVVLISLEMPEQVYAKRISAQLSKIPSDDLKLQISPLKNFLNQYKVKNKSAKLVIKEFPPKGVTVLGIKSYLKKLEKNNIKPDVVIIDYLNLIAPPTNGLSSYESVKQISEEVRALSYHFSCPIVSATQATRAAVTTPKPELDKTSESMGLSHTVDAQISIWTEQGDSDLGIIHMGIEKNRFGPRQVYTHLEIDYPTLSLSEPTDAMLDLVDSKSARPPKISDDIEKNSIDEIENSNIFETLNSFENVSFDDEK
jgi:replicative DNA helicase